MNPRPRFRLRIFAVLLLLALEISLAGWSWNLDVALLIALGSLLCLWFYHLFNIARLLRWAQEPLGQKVPDGIGVWSHVFAAIYRRTMTQREQREQLLHTLERFREVAQSLPEGVLILSDHLLIEWLNANAEAHLGITPSQDIGYPITNILRDQPLVAFLQARRYSEPLVLRPLRNPGRVLSLQLAPFREGQLLLLSRDITQMEKLETMRRDFVANVSHELKTPLTVVSGFIETLSEGLDDIPKEEARHFLALAAQQSERMQRLIEDLLTLSALETGTPSPLEERIEMTPLLVRLRQEAQTLSDGRHRIEIDDAGPAVVLGSLKELRSVFINLISNAISYTPLRGSIKIGWRSLDDGGAAFSVCDNGIGIAPEHLPRLTERFYRADRGRTRDSGGTGLGLAIVKHALERHGGTLKIESRLGEGSTFTAILPAQRIKP